MLFTQSTLTTITWIMLSFALTQCSGSVNGSGNKSRIVKRDLTPEEQDRLLGLTNSYKGIWWDVAFPGAGNKDGGCSIDQFNILAEATRMGVKLADFQGDALLQEDSPSNRLFVRNSRAPEGGRWTSSQYQTAYTNLHHNLFLPSRFVVQGKGTGLQRTRVTYQCKDPRVIPPGTTGCAGGGVPAYTMQGSYTGTGVTTVFCPLFFSKKYLNDIAAGPRKTIDDFGDPRLMSYEQIMVHEWMHADVMGFRGHIDDIKDSVDQSDPTVYPIYGMSRCRDWAWKFMRDPCCGHINPATVWNADNYAWYFANKYFAELWGWTDDGSPPGFLAANITTSDSIGQPENLTYVTDLPSIPWPSACQPTPIPDAVNVTFTCTLDPPAPNISMTTTSQSAPTPSTTRTPCVTVKDCPANFCESGYSAVCQTAFERKRTYDPYFCVCLPDTAGVS